MTRFRIMDMGVYLSKNPGKKFKRFFVNCRKLKILGYFTINMNQLTIKHFIFLIYFKKKANIFLIITPVFYYVIHLDRTGYYVSIACTR